jgi:hypothetical protein
MSGTQSELTFRSGLKRLKMCLSTSISIINMRVVCGVVLTIRMITKSKSAKVITGSAMTFTNVKMTSRDLTVNTVGSGNAGTNVASKLVKSSAPMILNTISMTAPTTGQQKRAQLSQLTSSPNQHRSLRSKHLPSPLVSTRRFRSQSKSSAPTENALLTQQ